MNPEYIERLHLINYKSARDITVDLRPLTVLSGLNDSGKSTLWEPLLLLAQSQSALMLERKGLVLNGSRMEAGVSGDVWRDLAEEGEELAIEISSGNEIFTWRLNPWHTQQDVIPLVLKPVPAFIWDVVYLDPLGSRGDLYSDTLATVKPGTVVILNHPEHRLHGSLATQVGRNISRAVARGVQVIVETHSDHVLNGIRCEVHAGALAPHLVGFLHCQRTESNLVVDLLNIDRHGRIDRWPDNFFDQYGKDLGQLLEKNDA